MTESSSFPLIPSIAFLILSFHGSGICVAYHDACSKSISEPTPDLENVRIKRVRMDDEIWYFMHGCFSCLRVGLAAQAVDPSIIVISPKAFAQGLRSGAIRMHDVPAQPADDLVDRITEQQASIGELMRSQSVTRSVTLKAVVYSLSVSPATGLCELTTKTRGRRTKAAVDFDLCSTKPNSNPAAGQRDINDSAVSDDDIKRLK
jgi:hypothetical protein